MKRVWFSVAATMIALGTMVPSAFADTSASTLYSDVTAGSYGAKQIVALTEDGYLHGFANGTFRPGDIVTRNQFLLYFMSEVQHVNHVTPKSKQYSADVSIGKRFHNNAPVSLGDIASLFVATMQNAGRIQLPRGASPLQYAANLGIFQGVTLPHKNLVNRASVAIVLYNILQWSQGSLLPSGYKPVVTSRSHTVDPNTVVQLQVFLRNASGHIVSFKDAQGQSVGIPSSATVSYSVNKTVGAFLLPSTGSLMVTNPGVYQVTAWVDGVPSAPYTITVVDQPAGVQLSTARSVLVANGKQTDTIQATVVDVFGQPVTSFNGTATLMPLLHGTYVDAATGAPIESVTFVHGVARFEVKAGTTGGVSDTISVSDLAPINGQPYTSSINYGSATIEYSWATDQPEGIQLTPASSVVVANGQQIDPIQATVVDAFGQRVTNFNGTAALTPLVHGTYVDPVSGAPITSVTFVHGLASFGVKAGTTGNVSDTISLSNLTPSGAQPLMSSISYGSATIDYSWPVQQPAGVQLSAAASVLVANGQQTDTVTATIVNAFGEPVTNFDGTATLTPLQHGAYVDPSTGAPITSVTFTNGVAQFEVQAGTVGNVSDTISLNDLTSANAQSVTSSINYASTTIDYTWPTASTIDLIPSRTLVSNNQPTEATINATITDAAGAAVTSGTPVYATFTLSGPGSFQQNGSPLTTLGEYLIPGIPTIVPVWSIPGQSGTITVAASAPGLSPVQATLKSVATGTPSSLNVASAAGTVSALGSAQAPTLAMGTPFTLYTVGLTDANGSPVIPGNSDLLTISDNTGTVGGTLEYFVVDNGEPMGPALTAAELQQSISSSTGEAQFAVVSTQSGSASPTITVTDSLGLSQNVQYSFSTGTAAYAMFPLDNPADLSGAISNVEGGQTATYVVQLEDVNGNPLTTAGQPVDFYFSGKNVAKASINGSSAWTSANPFVAVTNPQGQAFVTVTVPYGAAGAGMLEAAVSGGANVSGELVQVEPASLYTTQLILATAPGSTAALPWPSVNMTVGQTLTQFVGAADSSISSLYATPENYVGAYVKANDRLEITTSNPNVLSITGNTNWSAANGSAFVFTGSSQNALPTITAEQPGIATLTILDVSNPSAPRITETVDVTS